MSHKEAVEFFRHKLLILSSADFKYYLPKVLAELIDSHTNDPRDNEGAEAVLDILDVKRSANDDDWAQKEFGPEAAQYASEADNRLGSILDDLFKDFTSAQAVAILDWLLLAATWRDFQRCQDTLSQATAFWKKRVG